MEHRYFSIDIGGTATKYAHFDRGGKMQEHRSVATPTNKEDFLKLLDQLVGKLEDSVVGIGVSVPGIVDPMEGTVTFTGALSFMGTLTWPVTSAWQVVARFLLVTTPTVRPWRNCGRGG